MKKIYTRINSAIKTALSTTNKTPEMSWRKKSGNSISSSSQSNLVEVPDHVTKSNMVRHFEILSKIDQTNTNLEEIKRVMEHSNYLTHQDSSESWQIVSDSNSDTGNTLPLYTNKIKVYKELDNNNNQIMFYTEAEEKKLKKFLEIDRPWLKEPYKVLYEKYKINTYGCIQIMKEKCLRCGYMGHEELFCRFWLKDANVVKEPFGNETTGKKTR